MRRGVHIAVALLAVLLLIGPFDCFADGKFDQKAADCCKKGKCSPSNSDDCCKGTVPDGNQISPKAPDNPTPLHVVITAEAPVVMALVFAASLPSEAHAAPGSPPGSRVKLPLLI
jgi:hypothetical protein